MSYEYKYNGELFDVRNVNLKYGDKQILRDINFVVKDIQRTEIPQGQVISIIGRSGIGKTQLFRILSGLNNPTIGEVLIGDNKTKVKPGNVGVIPQNYILFNHRTVEKNIILAARTSKASKETIQYYIDKFDLTPHLKKYPKHLSGGQKQRVSIVQQILAGNRFILMDEPFSGLDSIMIDKVLDTIRKFSNENEINTLFIISHDLENCLSVSDTALIIAKEEGKEGATIIKHYNLADMDIAWRPNNTELPAFRSLLKEIKSLI